MSHTSARAGDSRPGANRWCARVARHRRSYASSICVTIVTCVCACVPEHLSDRVDICIRESWNRKIAIWIHNYTLEKQIIYN